jgi:hypothetical protein
MGLESLISEVGTPRISKVGHNGLKSFLIECCNVQAAAIVQKLMEYLMKIQVHN